MSFSISALAAKLTPLADNIPAPSLILKDSNGIEHNLEQYRGKIVLIQFWVSYCEPCITEMPSVNRLKVKLKQAGIPFKVLAVNLAESLQDVNKFLKTVNTNFTILMDSNATAQQDWNVYSVPKSYIINTHGHVIYYVNGAIEWDTKDIVKLLSKAN